jgi:hypothetical protein
VYLDGEWVGYIESVRYDFLDTRYHTHDGLVFSHWGGTTRAQTSLIERYWRYVDPLIDDSTALPRKTVTLT